MYDSILIPTDGSAGAKTAARHGQILATAFDSELHVLSVVDERSYSSVLADLDPVTGKQQQAFEQQATEAVAELEALVAETSITCHTAVKHGVPSETIRSYASEHEIGLISMGTHGRTGLDRLLLGSVTERVVRTSDVPVLTSRSDPDKHSDYNRILIPTDGSESAAKAVEHGTAIADRYNATIHALSVVDTGALAGASDVGPVIPDLLDILEKQCEQAVTTVAEKAKNRRIEVTTEVTQGTPYRTIQTAIEEQDIDLVTMGTHGRTGLDRYLIGSVTERTVRTSDVPVLTIR